jgi:hypothetical protein
MDGPAGGARPRLRPGSPTIAKTDQALVDDGAPVAFYLEGREGTRRADAL